MQGLDLKKPALLLLSLISTLTLSAEENANVSESTFMENHGDLIYMVIAMVIILVVVSVVLALTHFMMTELYSLRREIFKQQGREVPEDEEGFVDSIISKISASFSDSVPIEEEESITFDHEYDGIRELDNSLPPWWTAMFYASIAFGVIYIGWFHFSDKGMLQIAEYNESLRLEEVRLQAYLDRQANLVNENNVTTLTDNASLAKGLRVFNNSTCPSCHGDEGQGTSSAPNLTDQYWLHGGGIKNVFTTIKYGVPDKGMIAWGEQMSPVDLHLVASYVMSLQGTNPANPKAPEGELWVETDEAAASEISDTVIITTDSIEVGAEEEEL